MPQLDLYIWSLTIFVVIFFSVLLYFFVVFFFLVKLVRTLFLKKFYVNYVNYLNLFMLKYEYVLSSGLLSIKVSDLLGVKRNLICKMDFIFNLYFAYYNFCYFFNNKEIVSLVKDINILIVKTFILK